MSLLPPVHCFSDSFFMRIYSVDMSGEIRLMLNLYVNFNIEAIQGIDQFFNFISYVVLHIVITGK